LTTVFIDHRRYGFRFESFFQNYSFMKGRNRNTVWLSITEEEWPEIEEIYIRWLETALNGKHESLSLMTDKLSS
jgi:hypothetical protein